jgi:hypothetical protein
MYTGQAGSLDEEVAEEGNAVDAAPNVAGGGPGVADTKSSAAHDAYEQKRLKEYANKKDPVKNIKDIVNMLLPRFIDQVSRETGIAKASVTLVDRNVIYRRRTQALQAARLKRKAELDARETVPKTNLKHEVGPKASAAPRGITQYTEEMAIQTGRVGLLVKEVLKHCEFYQPGNSPADIAASIRKLTEIALEAANAENAGSSPKTTAEAKHKSGAKVSGLHDTDYSKMDETISEYIYSWFVEFVMAFVHESDRKEVEEILAANVDFTTMLNGKPIKVGFKNNSGSGVTTELNTFISAFVEFVSTCISIAIVTYRLRHNKELKLADISKTAIRTALKDYAGRFELTHLYWGDFMFRGNDVDIYSIPYAVIGGKFGDDGVAAHLPGIPDEDWEAAALFFTRAIGMVLKVTFSRPEDGTFFLGRYYPKPLESLASYADVLRALRKISVARNSDVEKYKMKLYGYWTTDSQTPGIREYLIAVAKMYNVDLHAYEGIVERDDEGTPMLSAEMSRLLAMDRDMFYRVAGGPYCVTEDDVPMMLEAIATQVNFDCSSEFESWLQSLEQCATWDDLDAIQLPGMDYDPDAEPEGTVRMSGPVANLLTVGPSTSQDGESTTASELSFDDLAAAAEIALNELLEVEEQDEMPADPVV